MAFGYDPSVSAYLRAMGVDEQNILAGAREQANFAERQYNRTIPMWNEKTRAAVQGVYDDAETRGVYRSGATLRGAARARANVGMEQAEARASANDQGLSYGLDAARRIAEGRRGATEAGLSGRSATAASGAQARYG
jgi:hypothetical protein